MERKVAIMAIITGIAILGGSASHVSSFMSNSSGDDVLTFNQGTALSGYVQIIVYDPNGDIKRYITGDNIITNMGENCIAEFIAGVDSSVGTTACADTAATVGNAPFDVIRIGTNVAAPDETSQTLGTALLVQSPITGVIQEATSTSSKAIITWIATFTATTSTVFTESGIFDTTTGGANMLAHKAFSTAATLTSGDTVAVTWVIDVGPN